MIKKILIYLILLIVYIFLPGITQQVFMTYDNYYFYIIATFLLIVNILFAVNFLKLKSKLFNLIAAVFATSIGITSVIVVLNLNLDWKGIEIALFSNAISSILAWEFVFQLNKNKTAYNTIKTLAQ